LSKIQSGRRSHHVLFAEVDFGHVHDVWDAPIYLHVNFLWRYLNPLLRPSCFSENALFVVIGEWAWSKSIPMQISARCGEQLSSYSDFSKIKDGRRRHLVLGRKWILVT